MHDNIMRMHEHPFIALAAAIAQVVPVVVVVVVVVVARCLARLNSLQ